VVAIRYPFVLKIIGSLLVLWAVTDFFRLKYAHHPIVPGVSALHQAEVNLEGLFVYTWLVLGGVVFFVGASLEKFQRIAESK
jgi:hypothetical protein